MPEFRIAAAQVASKRGDLDANLAAHAAAISVAGAHGISVLVFPELSLTGYEPDLAESMAMSPNDPRLQPLRSTAMQRNVSILFGLPLSNGAMKPSLGVVLFEASGAISTYAKMHLGAQEHEFFAPGAAPLVFAASGHVIGTAICADSSQASHAQLYANKGATVYAAGVFLNAAWYPADAPRLAAFALQHQWLVVMANHAASVGTLVSVGDSAIWGPDGKPVAQARGTQSCLVVAESVESAWRGQLVAL